MSENEITPEFLAQYGILFYKVLKVRCEDSFDYNKQLKGELIDKALLFILTQEFLPVKIYSFTEFEKLFQLRDLVTDPEMRKRLDPFITAAKIQVCKDPDEKMFMVDV